MPARPGAVILAAALLAPGTSSCRSESQLPPAIAAYRASFADAVGSEFTATLPRAQLPQRLRGCRVLWLGDHHRSSRLHALQQELLRELGEQQVPLVLALEAIGQQDEPDVSAFLQGDLAMPALRERVRRRWPGSWLDDRELDPWHYQSLLSFAKRTATPVLALEPTPRLPIHERDGHIASAIQAAANTFPDRLVVVVVGQAHLIGDGDLIARTGLPHLAIGGEMPKALAGNAPTERTRGDLLASSGGLWWFSDLL